MLSPEEVKPLLIHEDTYIREAAIDYFCGGWSRDPEIVPLLVESYRRFGGSKRLNPLSCGHEFPVDDAGIDAVLAAFVGARTLDGYSLGRILASASPSVLARRWTEIEKSVDLPLEASLQVERRVALAALPADRLWQDLRDLAARRDGDDGDDDDVPEIDALVAALAERDFPSEETVCEMLASWGKDDGGGWLEIALVDLAGMRRMHKAIGALIDKFLIDTDLLLERAVVALGRIGDVEAVRRLRARFLDESFGFKIYAQRVFGDIKHTESEDALVELIGREEDGDLRTMLCGELCRLFSARGVAVVADEIRRGYSRGVDCLEDRVLPVAEVLGIELPEGDAWREAREERERRQFDRAQELAELGRKYAERERIAAVATAMTNALRRREVAGRYDDGMDDDRVAASADASPVDAVCTTIRNTNAKIGRNDPCPCGSGKKFKKCCG